MHDIETQTTSSLQEEIKIQNAGRSKGWYGRGKLALTSGDIFLADCAFHELLRDTARALGRERDDHQPRCQSVQTVDSYQ
jgi:hypothetical protein